MAAAAAVTAAAAAACASARAPCRRHWTAAAAPPKPRGGRAGGDDGDLELHVLGAVVADAAEEPPPALLVERDAILAGAPLVRARRLVARLEVRAAHLHHRVVGALVPEHCTPRPSVSSLSRAEKESIVCTPPPPPTATTTAATRLFRYLACRRP